MTMNAPASRIGGFKRGCAPFFEYLMCDYMSNEKLDALVDELGKA